MTLIARDDYVDKIRDRNLTFRALASRIGCAPQTLNNLASGRTVSVNGVHLAEAIAAELNMPIERLFIKKRSKARENRNS